MTIARALSHDRHNPAADLRLGCLLAFVAGATNAGGFLAVGRYTSHMTGMLSSIADNLVIGEVGLAASALASVATFLSGAVTTSLIVSWARRRHLRSRHALPLLLEAALLLVFGVMGASAKLHVGLLPATVVLLCFMMGLQNAVITHISNAVIRTTHITGLLTDLGIEIGKLLYVNRTAREPRVHADRERLRVHLSLIGSFSLGAGFGAFGFKAVGYSVTTVLSVALFWVCWRPLLDDIRIQRRVWRRVNGPKRASA